MITAFFFGLCKLIWCYFMVIACMLGLVVMGMLLVFFALFLICAVVAIIERREERKSK